jgi:hypothetical protein
MGDVEVDHMASGAIPAPPPQEAVWKHRVITIAALSWALFATTVAVRALRGPSPDLYLGVYSNHQRSSVPSLPEPVATGQAMYDADRDIITSDAPSPPADEARESNDQRGSEEIDAGVPAAEEETTPSDPTVSEEADPGAPYALEGTTPGGVETEAADAEGATVVASAISQPTEASDSQTDGEEGEELFLVMNIG